LGREPSLLLLPFFGSAVIMILLF